MACGHRLWLVTLSRTHISAENHNIFLSHDHPTRLFTHHKLCVQLKGKLTHFFVTLVVIIQLTVRELFTYETIAIIMQHAHVIIAITNV